MVSLTFRVWWGWLGDREVLVKGYKLPVLRRVGSGGLMDSRVIIVSKTFIYLQVAKRKS